MKNEKKMKILDEVREITSEAKSKQEQSAKNKYPELIAKIKEAAKKGVCQCEFSEGSIDEFSKKMLNADGFMVYLTTNSQSGYYTYKASDQQVWIVSW